MATALALPAVLVGTALGIVLTDVRQTPVALAAAVASLLVGGAVGAARRPTLGLVCLTLAGGLALGAWRGAALELPSRPGTVSTLIGAGEVPLVATVLEDPRPRVAAQQAILGDVVTKGRDGRAHPLRGRLLATLPRSLVLEIGDRVRLTSAVEAPEAFEGFDYPAYLARQGVGGLVRVRNVRVLGGEGDASLASVAAAARRWLLDGLNAMVPEPEAALGAGILLGVRTSIAPEISSSFAIAGLTHVVAISGWNIAIVAAIVATLARPLERRRGGRWLAPAAAGSTIAAYVVLTGASPSVVRAALMAGAMMVARLGGSRAHAASALALAAVAMLVVAPAVLWDIGFQLSALATGGLILFAAPIEGRLAGWPGWLREPIALTLAAQLTTLPVVLSSFGRLSLVAPIANVAVVPLVPLVMLVCAIAAPLGALTSGPGLELAADAARWAVGGCAWLLLRAVIVAGQAAAAVPFAALSLSAPTWLPVAWYPLLALAWRRVARPSTSEPPSEAELRLMRPARRRSPRVERLAAAGDMLGRPVVGLAGLGVLLAALTIASQPDGRLHLVVLDVGQGDAILVRAPSGGTLLVDGGPDPDLLLRRLGERLPWWQRRIDTMILTHPHEDHVAGLVAALQRYQVGLVLDTGRDYGNPTYPRFLALARGEPGAHFMRARAGQRFRLDATTSLTLLYPTDADVAAPLPEGDINNASFVGLLRSGGFAALLTGDAHTPIETMLAERGLLSRVDVLKVGHHGSRSSSSPAFLRVIHPGAAIISCGIGNAYGHPHQVTLDHLHAVSALRLHRTDQEGSVEVVSDGRRYQVRSRLVTDPWRPVVSAAVSIGQPTGSIGSWPSRPLPRLSSCSPPTTCPLGSSPIRVGSVPWRRRRRGSWRRPASRSIRSSSRSPPCSTTWTSRRRAAMASTESSPRAG